MLKLITIRRQGQIAVLGRNLAVRVLMEKTARLESQDTTINDVDHAGTAPDKSGPTLSDRVTGRVRTCGAR
jgi:hypothetical protein